MKPTFLVLICVLATTLAGAVAALLFSENAQGENALPARQDLEASFERLSDSFLLLQSRMDQLEASPRVSPPLDMQALRSLDHEYHRHLRKVQAELGTLKSAKTKGKDAASSLVAAAEQAAIDDAMGRVVDKALAKRDLDRRQSERMRWSPFIKVQMQMEMQKTLDKLNLKPDQKEQFEESVSLLMDQILPAWGVAMGSTAEQKEKMVAFTQIDNAMKVVSTDAQRYMDMQQYAVFSKDYDLQVKEVDKMRTMQGAQEIKSGDN